MARKLTIMGAGGTGLALAAEWTLAGHDVTLYDDPEHEDILAAVRRAGHIEADRPEGTLKAPAPATAAGHDRLALHAADTELFAFCCTAWRQEAMIEAVLPLLKDGQTLLLSVKIRRPSLPLVSIHYWVLPLAQHSYHAYITHTLNYRC